MSSDWNDYFKSPVKNVSTTNLPENGEYHGFTGQPEIKVSKDTATQLIEVPVTVVEGKYQGRKCVIKLYFVSKGKMSKHGLNEIMRLCDLVDPRIREHADSFESGLHTLVTLLNGRYINFRQYMNGKYTNLGINEVLPLEPGATQAPTKHRDVIENEELPF